MSQELEDILRAGLLDSEGGNYSIVDGLYEIGRVILIAADRLGNGGASTPMGALEAHGKAMLDSAEKISAALLEVAEAIREKP